MYKFNDLTGEKVGKLTVIEQNGRTKDRRIIWKCKCECGNIVNVSSHDLKNGHTKSCGCLQKEIISNIRYRHGDRDERLYGVWKSMKQRCENKNCKSYKWYGAKGVSVCSDWHDYSVFKQWAIEHGYDKNAEYGKCTIDRIDSYKDYSPDNCRWVSMAIQATNKRAYVQT